MKAVGGLLVLFFVCNMAGHIADAYTIVAIPDSGDVGISATVSGNASISITPSSSSTGFGFPATAVRFTGQAYPEATVAILKQGTQVATVVADATGLFSATLEEKYDSTIVYTLFATDVFGNRSLLINYPLAVYTGYLTQVSGILFAPTIVTDMAEVRFGDYLTVSGSSWPKQNMEVSVAGPVNRVFTLTSNADGSYKIVMPMLDLPRGNYVVYSQYVTYPQISKLVKFIIGDTNIPNTNIVQNIPGDCNADGVVNLVDFSILAFWYAKPNPPPCVDTNHDGIVNLVDFSILAFWWTG